MCWRWFMSKGEQAMNDSAGDGTGGPDSGKDAGKSSWPVRLYIVALVFAFLTLGVFTPALDGRASNVARNRAQVALLACATLRLAWALHTREKGKGWVFYVVLLFLAAPIWLLIEEPLWSLGRAIWGNGLNP
jgi:hypothetical protein